MFENVKMKYYDRLNELRAKPVTIGPDDKFDYEVLRSKGFTAWLANWMIDHPVWWMRILRNWFPLLVIGRIGFVSRAEDVKEVLEKQDVFETPFGPEMVDTSGGAEAVLGMQDGPSYRATKDLLARAFRARDIVESVTPLSAKFAAEAVSQAMGKIDAIQQLITAVPVRVCREYYGFDIKPEEERPFAEWAIGMSTLYFADFGGNEELRNMVLIGSAKLQRLAKRSLEMEKARTNRSDTPFGRLVEMQEDSPEQVSDQDICGAMISMVAGFVPTNTMAAAHMLEIVMRKPEAFDAATDAAKKDDDERLLKCLLEAMRFKPLNPGPMRFVNTDTVVAKGKKREKVLKKGITIVASTQSGMMDDQAVKDPLRYDPDRPDNIYLLYGHGMHWCIGAMIANAQITQTLKALLKMPNLRRTPGKAGKLAKWGAFPHSMYMEYDT